MNTKDQIKKLFDELQIEEQDLLIRELSERAKTSLIVKEFSSDVQKRFGISITFEILQSGPSHLPKIRAIVITPYGRFTGEGGNQKVAKANACLQAKQRWPKFTKK